MSNQYTETNPARSTTEGIYNLPVIGQPLQRARRFYDDMQPTPADTLPTRVGKRMVQVGSVTVAAGVATLAVF